jgi:hypothetical protein
MRTKLTVVCAAVALVAIAGGTAQATGLIHTGNIANGAITFDKLSPGVQKQIWATGKNGAPGANGATGATGTTGATGAMGLAGPKGATGAMGPEGPVGDESATGAKGDPGAPGAQGPAGPTGAAGADSNTVRPVTASNLQGFVLAPDGDNTPAYGGPDAPGNGAVGFAPSADAPLGANALDMRTITGMSVAVFLPSAGTKGRLLSELTSFGYASKVISQPGPDDDVTAQIEVVGSTATHFASGYTTVVFEPYVNGEAGLTGWHRSDVVHGKVWSTKPLPSGDCSQAVPCPFSTFVAENPRATVLDAKFRIGQNSGTPATDAGEYLVDDVVYGFGTTMNFDLGA